jgi:hypothetical protein
MKPERERFIEDHISDVPLFLSLYSHPKELPRLPRGRILKRILVEQVNQEL